VPRLPIPTDLAALPIDAARSLLVPPVRALRQVAVAAARTVRHWEVVLSMASAPTAAADEVDLRDSDELPVEDWAQLSLADAQARASSCSPTELAALLAYEQQHGHRMAFELMLQQKLRHHVG